jgi:hypothetical protein
MLYPVQSTKLTAVSNDLERAAALQPLLIPAVIRHACEHSQRSFRALRASASPASRHRQAAYCWSRSESVLDGNLDSIWQPLLRTQ